MCLIIIPVVLCIIIGIILYLAFKEDYYSSVCPVCKHGTITYEFYGSADQFCNVVESCGECGYDKDDFTEDVLWPTN